MVTKKKLYEKLLKIHEQLKEHKKNLDKDRKNLSSLMTHLKLAQDVYIAEAYVKGFDDGQRVLIEEILQGELIDSTKNNIGDIEDSLDEIGEFMREMDEILHRN